MTNRNATVSAILLVILAILGLEYLIHMFDSIVPLSDFLYRVISYVWIITSGFWAFYLLRKLRNQDKAYWHFKASWSTIGYVVVSFILIFFVMVLSILWFPRTLNDNNLITVRSSVFGIEKLLILPIITMVFAPITEELIHRGLVMTLADKYSNGKLGVIIAAITFSILHLPYYDMRLTDFIRYFATGLVLGWCYKKSNSIYGAIMAHMCWNIFVFLLKQLLG